MRRQPPQTTTVDLDRYDAEERRDDCGTARTAAGAGVRRERAPSAGDRMADAAVPVYVYIIHTDAVMEEIEAPTIDAAAVAFAAGEGIKGVDGVVTLLAAYERIGDGAWVSIESNDAPDGTRQAHGQ